MPEVGFEQSNYSVAEGSENRLFVTVVSNALVPDGVVQADINNLTAKGQKVHYIKYCYSRLLAVPAVTVA